MAIQMDFFPASIIQLGVEISENHPTLRDRISQEFEAENITEPQDRFILIAKETATYCGIVLDGEYKINELADRLLKELKVKSSPIITIH